jgi:protein O-GlcNAc transferase
METLVSQRQTLARALAAFQAGDLGQAELFCKRVLEADRKQFDALHMLGVIEAQRGDFAAGARRLKAALRVRPDSADALINLGRMQSELGDNVGAMASFQRALVLAPQSALAHVNFGIVLSRLRRSEEALTHCNAALAVAPGYALAWNCRGNVLAELERPVEALESYDRALHLDPKLAEAQLGRASTLQQLYRYEDALAAYDRALALRADLPGAWYSRGRLAFLLKRYDEAIAAYDKARALDADYADSGRLAAKLQICDWTDLEAECTDIAAAVTRKGLKTDPFRMLAISASPAVQLRSAEIFTADQCPPAARPIWRREIYRHDRIRLAYISSDFRNHPMAYLTAGMFEAHDHSRFETTAVSIFPAGDDGMRERLRGAFDHFLDLSLHSNHAIAETLRSREIDIAVDLNGYTTHSRTAIFALRPVPVQASYLGFPGSMGASFIDYILADRTVIPDEHVGFYTEKVAWLPDSYYVNDRTRRVAERVPMREELSLPSDGFVFCCFNNSFKITPALFDIWMRLLRQVDGSVLWLFEENDAAVRNLRAEAVRRGVAPERLVFAPRVPVADHLARHRQADLLLDTLPYNAHTTACDALWVGVPVLTCLGTTFVGRVAASLLKSIGLPELITTSLEDYEALALRIASEPDLRAALKQRLARNRDTFPLFDTRRFTRHMEAAYTTMWERHQRGEPPQSFAVAPV